jgi:hypothetical protein
VENESQKLYGASPKLFELDQLGRMFKTGRLELAPKYQRGYVWKPEKASRPVVTALCNRIVPGIVLHEITTGVYEVVDGKQRITTLLAFYLAGDDEDPNHDLETFEKLQRRVPNVTSTLSKLDENYEQLEGLTFKQLTKNRQNALAAYTIPCVIVPFNTPKHEVFSVYEDINSGGEDLKAQQLRRAVFYGPYIELLDRLVQNEDFQCIRDPKSFRAHNYHLDPKESDRELVLRAFAFKNRWTDYTRPIKKFLNSELEAFEQMDEKTSAVKLTQMEDEFKWVMRVWRNVFGASDGAFRKWEQGKSGLWGWGKTIVSIPLWDALYPVLAELRVSRNHPESVYSEYSDKIMSKLQELFESGELELSGALTVIKFSSRKDTLSGALR